MAADLLVQVASQILPAAEEAINFFAEGVVSFITQPIDEALEEYERALEQSGAQQVLAAIDTSFCERDRLLSQQIVQQSAQLETMPPQELIAAPQIVTAKTVQIKQEALARIERVQTADTNQVSLQDLVEAMREEQEATEEAFRIASLVAGASRQTQPVFPDMESLVRSIQCENRIPREELEQMSDAAHVSVREELAQAWTACTLAAAQQALEVADFSGIRVDAQEGTISAQDRRYDGGSIAITASAEDGQLGYELKGYSGDDCEGAEMRFIQALAVVLGRDIGPQNLTRRDTAPPQRQLGRSESAAEPRLRESLRDRH